LAAQWYEAEQMRITIAAVLALLAGAAGAEPSTLFYNERGQITGSASTSGKVTTFRDRQGRMSGTAERMGDGSTMFRDGRGRLIGSATALRR
jgi:YD repeat-containing protein